MKTKSIVTNKMVLLFNGTMSTNVQEKKRKEKTAIIQLIALGGPN